MLSAFNTDIAALDNYEIIVKYLYNSKVWYFMEHLSLHDETYLNAVDKFHRIISDSFDISFKNILVVGSGKTGFSMNPSNYLRPFDQDPKKDSDLDVALISRSHFEDYWDIIRDHTSLKFSYFYDHFCSSIYRGFIPAKALSEIAELRREFNKSRDKANRTLRLELGITHDINFRIYRSWHDLEAYHHIGLEKYRKQCIDE